MEKKKEIVSMMEETRVFPPSEEIKKKAYIKTMDEYKALYKKSYDDPDGFWGEQAKELDWYKKWDKVSQWDFNKPELKWFIGGKLNVSYNCLDRHLATRGNKAALIWQGEPPEENKVFTYQQLHYQVCKFANVLKKHGVKKGDRVSIYLPMIPELPIAMLACSRIGAIHSVVLEGLAPRR
jgi:acetyl-CoA synthetase